MRLLRANSLAHSVAYLCSEGTADAPNSLFPDPQHHHHHHHHQHQSAAAALSFRLGQMDSMESLPSAQASSPSLSAPLGSAGSSATALSTSIDMQGFSSTGALPAATPGAGPGTSLPLADSSLASTGGSSSAIWFVRDPCGIACAVITHLLVYYACFVVSTVLLRPSEYPFELYSLIVFLTLAVLALWSHVKAMLTNPGTVPRGPPHFVMEKVEKTKPLQVNGEFVTNCVRCNNYKPARAHHCSICERCVRKMDHHCPWVNNCVGQYNHKYFLQFVAYIFMISGFALFLITYRVVDCANNKWELCPDWKASSSTIAFVASLGFEACLFGLFTLVMFFDQMCNITDDETGIERLQRQQHTGGRPTGAARPKAAGAAKKASSSSSSSSASTSETLVQICGSSPGYLWLIPMKGYRPLKYSRYAEV